jgi:hypothetical protein
MRALGPGWGPFKLFIGPSVYISERFGVSGERGPTGGSAQGLNRMGSGIGGSGQPSRTRIISAATQHAGVADTNVAAKWASSRGHRRDYRF